MIFSYPEARYDPSPFPHAVVRDAWDQDTLREAKAQLATFNDWDGEKNFRFARRKRFCQRLEALPLACQDVILEATSDRFVRWLEQLTGEPELLADTDLIGGGVHQISRGGFLGVHVDFNYNTETELYRRLNVLLYLNPDWQDEWGGHLELWQNEPSNVGGLPKVAKTIAPEINTMVVFTTDDNSFHGHPHPLQGPNRDSIALYYYSKVRPANFSERGNTAYKI
jgi:Rps23 Pro-64 3,4-dihydroxylase Tpa1-like proline 4-hydroxylase